MVFWVVTNSFHFMLCQSSLLSTVVSFLYKEKWWWLIFLFHALQQRGKPGIGQFLRGSLPRLTNDRDTKYEKLTSVSFDLLWSEKCKQNRARFWTKLGYKLRKLKSASRLGTERSEILNCGSTQHIKTLFNDGFSLAACNQCYTALCQFSNGIGA